MSNALVTIASAASMMMSLAVGIGVAGHSPVTSVILMQRGPAESEGWEAVYKALKEDGYRVTFAQVPTRPIAGELAVMTRAIAAVSGEAALTGHSHGGGVLITAGIGATGARLVSVDVSALDTGASARSLIANLTKSAARPQMMPEVDGYPFVARALMERCRAPDHCAKSTQARCIQISQFADCLKGAHGCLT